MHLAHAELAHPDIFFGIIEINCVVMCVNDLLNQCIISLKMGLVLPINSGVIFFIIALNPLQQLFQLKVLNSTDWLPLVATLSHLGHK